ncbi:MAG: flagellar basal body rod protein FlgC [Candidatus Melainabacteria bacterium]
MNIFDITASALTAQRLRMDTISGNLANVNTTRNADGTPGTYVRKNVVFSPIYENALSNLLPHRADNASGLSMAPSPSGISMGPNGRPLITTGITNEQPGAGVQAVRITNGNPDDMKAYHIPNHPDADENGMVMLPKDMRMVYDPAHPDAIKDGELRGYVIFPNINPITEMVDMMTATRAYEANVTALQSAKQMNQAALEI